MSSVHFPCKCFSLSHPVLKMRSSAEDLRILSPSQCVVFSLCSCQEIMVLVMMICDVCLISHWRRPLYVVEWLQLFPTYLVIWCETFFVMLFIYFILIVPLISHTFPVWSCYFLEGGILWLWTRFIIYPRISFFTMSSELDQHSLYLQLLNPIAWFMLNLAF